MIYTVIGVVFIMLFGIGIGYEVLWIGDGGGWQEVEELRGSPVKFNLTGHIVPVTEVEYAEVGLAPAKHDLPVGELNDPVIYRCVAFMAVICVCEFFINSFKSRPLSNSFSNFYRSWGADRLALSAHQPR